jgi:hypothetical protein
VTDLSFDVADVFVESYAVAPQLTARLRITESSGETVHTIALRAQVRIEPQRRSYTTDEEHGVRDLFGERERWYDTLKPFLWMHTSVLVQGFAGVTEVDLPLPCTYDFDVTASKYLHALHGGHVCVVFLFSGTVFTRGERGFAVSQVPWDREARYELPVAVWRELIDRYYPGTGWIRLDRDLITVLAAYKVEHGLTTWDEALDRLLPATIDGNQT